MSRPVVLGQPWDTTSAPPWDGTGVPFPVDGSGWPQLPGGGAPVVVLTLTSDAPGPGVGEGLPITLTAVADVDGGVPTLYYRRVSDAPGTETTAPMTAAAEPLTYTGVVIQPPYTNGAPVIIDARIGTNVSNTVTVQTSPVPVLTLEALSATVVEGAPPPIRLHTDKGVRGPQELWWSTTDEAALVQASGFFIQSSETPPQGGVWFDWLDNTVPLTGPAGGTVLYRGRDSAAGGVSNVVSVPVISGVLGTLTAPATFTTPGEVITLSLTTDAPQVDGNVRADPGLGPMTMVDSTHWTRDVNIYPPGGTYSAFLFDNDDVRSNEVSVTQATGETLAGWTKDELLQFAADHEPPIEVPSSATKAQIIELILDALAEDEADKAGPRSDWTVPRLDEWAEAHSDLAPDYPADANKPEKLAYLKSVTKED